METPNRMAFIPLSYQSYTIMDDPTTPEGEYTGVRCEGTAGCEDLAIELLFTQIKQDGQISRSELNSKLEMIFHYRALKMASVPIKPLEMTPENLEQQDQQLLRMLRRMLKEIKRSIYYKGVGNFNSAVEKLEMELNILKELDRGIKLPKPHKSPRPNQAISSK